MAGLTMDVFRNSNKSWCLKNIVFYAAIQGHILRKQYICWLLREEESEWDLLVNMITAHTSVDSHHLRIIKSV